MRVPSVSTYVLSNARRDVIANGQSELMQASYEAATRKLYDPGLTLGRKTGRLVNIESQMNYLEGFSDTNKLVMLRMSSMQAAIHSLIASGNEETAPGALTLFNNMLVSNPENTTPSVIQAVAQDSLSAFISALNTNYNGEYIFGGTNTSKPPLNFYTVGGETGSSKVVRDTFDKFLGDRKPEDLTSEEMEEFIDGPFSSLFDEKNFTKIFSNAQDGSIEKRISSNGETVNIAASTNEKGFRDAMKGMILVAEFGDIGLSKDAQESLYSRARTSTDQTATSSSVNEIIVTASRLGSAEARVKTATQRIEIQTNLLMNAKIDLISVDTTEAVQKIQALEAMLNLSYTLTARISQLSLINY
ncbi:flagellar hook-associated family protein [Bartonella bovis]|uniref:Flagellin n=1 Tax=Bartonella bovis m02 TaxID=1094492 RepID=N6VFJ7_9HYPH|nr:flagellar hook-associated family protein [Bartonella bovis]ENN89892.1 flagellar hook-associated protein FlgL [Bartonella bovis m02]